MFDSAPSNLPVEPTPASGLPLAPPMPSGTAAMPSAMPAPAPRPVIASGKKEPEDIFSGIEMGGDAPKPATLPAMVPVRSGFPLKPVLAGVIGLFVLGGGGFAAWYFLLRTPVDTGLPIVPAPTEQTPTPVAQQPVVETPPPEALPQPDGSQTPTTPPPSDELPTPVTQPPSGTNIPLPGQAPGTAAEATIDTTLAEGLDTDADALTDQEEQLIGTDLSNPDTDGDTYQDGAEIRGLYSPLGKGVAINAMTSLKRTSLSGMSFLLPNAWTISPSATDPKVLRIDTGSLAYLRVTTSDSTPEQAQAEVENRMAQGVAVTSKSGIRGALGQNGLELTFAIGGTLVTVDYIANGASAYEYRAMFALMFQSLQLGS